ncbi:ATP-binding cassette permease mdl1 [Coemansia sp. RSA 1813]|nr:ATP-binding cassette permease mdl1 [Coemansia sp. RSA 1646]KAJ1773906.1 ATP-binding cassette permease mdl1 [Coemansia sp. RSA 1843]KAJ2089374.1 ATP-binding cassette permease mdl1 [Coemansia sp. RSA 986]KAJ2214479.1 ATP-binding cassette permease mdl1 [Coemansia sp. RSA 487]KAJ2569299.1 ATP-binding cassette permease mdl1 [Coemansia sp. RSA 1813]
MLRIGLRTTQDASSGGGRALPVIVSRKQTPHVSENTPLLLTSTVARAGDGRYYSTVPREQRSPTPEPLTDTVSKKEVKQEQPNEFGVDPEEAQKAKSQKTGKAWLRLFRLAKPEYKLLGSAVGLLFVSSSITMAVPFTMGKIIDIVTNASATVPLGLSLGQVFAGLGAVFVVGAVANAGRVMLIRTAGERMVARIRRLVFDRIMRQDMGFFDRNRSGDLVSRLSVDTSIVSKSITNNVSDGLRASISAVVGVAMMVYVSPKLTAIMLGVVPPIALWAVIYGRFIKKLSKQTQEAVGDLTKVSEERISNVRTVQAFSRESQEVARYDIEVQKIFALAKREAVASGLFFGGNGLAGNLAILAFLGFGGRMVMGGDISIGDMTSVMLYSAYVGSALSGLSSFYSEVMKGVGAGSRLFYLLDRTPTVDPNPEGIVVKNFAGKIRFENVDFSYPTRPNAPVFQNLSLEIEPGSHVAIAGPSGKGKSTVTSLLLRFYDPQAGRVLVDGHDLRDLNLAQWRSHIAMVPQEPVLFAGTIRDNLLYGNPLATDSEIIEALELADAWYFVERFPHQLETYVGERGVSLSGGQKQRVAIARALLAQPDILVLDEATSALDGTREARVLKTLDKAPQLLYGEDKKKLTVITVAHRASTLMRSDLIFVLGEQGSVVETGSYQELLSLENGHFRALMAAQALEPSVLE